MARPATTGEGPPRGGGLHRHEVHLADGTLARPVGDVARVHRALVLGLRGFRLGRRAGAAAAGREAAAQQQHRRQDGDGSSRRSHRFSPQFPIEPDIAAGAAGADPDAPPAIPPAPPKAPASEPGPAAPADGIREVASRLASAIEALICSWVASSAEVVDPIPIQRRERFEHGQERHLPRLVAGDRGLVGEPRLREQPVGVEHRHPLGGAQLRDPLARAEADLRPHGLHLERGRPATRLRLCHRGVASPAVERQADADAGHPHGIEPAAVHVPGLDG